MLGHWASLDNYDSGAGDIGGVRGSLYDFHCSFGLCGGAFHVICFLTCHSPGRCCFLYLMSKTVLLISGSEEKT